MDMTNKNDPLWIALFDAATALYHAADKFAYVYPRYHGPVYRAFEDTIKALGLTQKEWSDLYGEMELCDTDEEATEVLIRHQMDLD